MEAAKASGFKKYLPNILSCIRIAGTFSLPFLMWESWEKAITLPLINKTFYHVPVVWLIVYVILLSSDKLDGTLARKLKAESELGAALDSIGDVLLLVMGATLCFVRFVGDSLETWQFWVYVGIMILCVLNKLLGFILSSIYHGKGNMIHSYFQKTFALGCYIGVFCWAFLRTIPEWSIYSLMAINIYATFDECIYCTHSASYNVDFKGHGFEKYEKRKKKTAA